MKLLSEDEYSKLEEQKRCEIIDGKQRLSTLVEFYENRFQYEGKYFTDLGFEDRHQFTSFNIVFGETPYFSATVLAGSPALTLDMISSLTSFATIDFR